MDKEHFICEGGDCGGVSDTPGVCTNEECRNHNKDLKSCNCGDESHHGRLESSDNSEDK